MNLDACYLVKMIFAVIKSFESRETEIYKQSQQDPMEDRLNHTNQLCDMWEIKQE